MPEIDAIDDADQPLGLAEIKNSNLAIRRQHPIDLRQAAIVVGKVAEPKAAVTRSNCESAKGRFSASASTQRICFCRRSFPLPGPASRCEKSAPIKPSELPLHPPVQGERHVTGSATQVKHLASGRARTASNIRAVRFHHRRSTFIDRTWFEQVVSGRNRTEHLAHCHRCGRLVVRTDRGQPPRPGVGHRSRFPEMNCLNSQYSSRS